MNKLQHLIESKILYLIVLPFLVISVAMLVELLPLVFIPNLNEPVAGVKPYTPLQLAGRDLYIREGCISCHSQQIRPFRAETERYGHYSVAGESVYDHPFLWGSIRRGPDLARVGGRYSDEWHKVHLINPRDVVPESNMPSFPWLAYGVINPDKVVASMKGLQKVGVPYTEEDIEKARSEVEGKTELEAIVAYLQGLGLAFRSANPAAAAEATGRK